MTIADLIRTCDFDSVQKKITLHYGDKDIEKFRKLYTELKKCSSPQKAEALTIIIGAWRETEDDSVYVEDFHEDDATLYYDVSGFVEGEEMLYSIASSPYEDFLSYSIDKRTAGNFHLKPYRLTHYTRQQPLVLKKIYKKFVILKNPPA